MDRKRIRKKALMNWVLFSLTVSAMVALIIGCSDRWEMIAAMEIPGVYGATGATNPDYINDSNADGTRNEGTGQTEGTEDDASDIAGKGITSLQHTDTIGQADTADLSHDFAQDTEQDTKASDSEDKTNTNTEQSNDSTEDTQTVWDAVPQPAFGMLSGREIDPDRPMIALSFDDGPYPPVTEELISFLTEYEARATFFVVGYNAVKYESTILEAYQNGFEIGNHTQSHASLKGLSKAGLHDEVDAINELLNSYGVMGNLYLRPPYGEHDASMDTNLNVPMITWSVDSQDWLSRDADTIEERIIGKCKDGDIVLMHDIYPSTLEAVKNIVPELIEEGFQLVTISEMFDAKGIEAEAGVCYNSAK